MKNPSWTEEPVIMVLRFSIAKKFVFAFLALSILPLCALGVSTLYNLSVLGKEAIDSSTAQLEKRAKESLEVRAIELANKVGQFLQSCEADLLTLQMLRRDPTAYQHFTSIHRRSIWTREGSNKNPIEVHKELPLYREAAFIGPDGMEKIRIVDDRILDPWELRDVSKPQNTTFKSEDYFQQTRKLRPGQMYISHVTGWYVTREEQLAGATSVEEAVEGKKYEGVIRFCVPCFDAHGEFDGMVVLSLDHRHLMELTLHILPTDERFVVFPSYSSGNYAFMFDDEGWLISHPKFYNLRGKLPDGSEVDPTLPSYSKERVLAGEVPFNMDHVSFINPNYPFIAREVRAGRSGVTSTFNVEGTQRVVAYAPIPYNQVPYHRYGIFGGITIGVEANKFKEPALLVRAKIDEIVTKTKRQSLMILGGTAFTAIFLGFVLARSFTTPIRYLTRKAQDIAAGEIPNDVRVHTGDEVELLALNFSRMAHKIRKHQESLERSLSELAQSKRSVESYSEQLEKQLKVLKNIHGLSQYLGNVYDRDLVLQKVLQSCVEGLGYDRAILYLYDPSNHRLVCEHVVGFDPEHATKAVGSFYDLDVHDCIPTKVFRSGETIFVRDVRTDPRVTLIDLRMAEQGETEFFVFTPIKTRDRVLGVLGADTKTTRRPIEETAIESLEILANDAARAVERSELHGELVSERNFIKAIVTHMTNGIITLDEFGIVTWFNPYSEEVFGIRPQDALGKSYRDVFKDLPTWVQAIDQYRNSEDVGQVSPQYHSVFHDGKEKILAVHYSKIRQDPPQQNIFVLFVRDVTQRKRMEDHIRRSDRLVSLGILAAGIAHEIRNPLTGISLVLDDLHDHLRDRPQERALIQKCVKEIDRLENLICGLLDFAVPSGRMSLQLRPLDEVVQHTLFLVRKLCKNQKISLSVDFEDHIPPLQLDPERFQQALLNLLLNAIHAMPTGGNLSLHVKNVSKEESLLGDCAVRIIVTDTGKGIAPEDMPYIFDPFFTRTPSGCGLGLAIVHSIIQDHSGRISVSSQLNQGTTVWIDLPKANRA